MTDSFSDTSKAVILGTFYIQNKTFVDVVQKYLGSDSCSGKSTEHLAALLQFFFPFTYLTYFAGAMLLSTVLTSVKFILSLFFSIFKYRTIMFFFSSTYLHPTSYKSHSAVSGNFLPGHINRHSKQLIYETNIFSIFNH